MADLPYTYTDEADDILRVTARPGPRLVTTIFGRESDPDSTASVVAPTGDDAVDLAEAVLAAAGLTDRYVVASRANMAEAERVNEGVNEGVIARLCTENTALRENRIHAVPSDGMGDPSCAEVEEAWEAERARLCARVEHLRRELEAERWGARQIRRANPFLTDPFRGGAFGDDD